MPRSKRDSMKRTVAQVVNHLQAAAEDVIALEVMFRGVHDHEADILALIIHGIDTNISLIKFFCVQAWGYAPDDWDDWRATGYIPVNRWEKADIEEPAENLA